MQLCDPDGGAENAGLKNGRPYSRGWKMPDLENGRLMWTGI